MEYIASEIWKDIPGYGGKYQISSFGRVKSFARNKNGKILKRRICTSGYAIASLSNNNGITKHSVKVHKIVASVFLEKPHGKTQINHIDGDKTNNNINNLEWVTASENMLHNVYILKRNKNNYCVPKKVLCVETGVIYKSAKEAERMLKIDNSSINAAASKKVKKGSRGCGYTVKTAGGFHWRFV